MKVLILDNFDSFTYNIQHYLEEKDVQVDVCRSNDLTLEQIRNYDRIILSPGPGLPQEYPFMMKLLEMYSGLKPILGICLGMQAIVEFLGGTLYNLNEVKHGVQERVQQLNSSILFQNVPSSFQVGLYHSWACKLPENSHLIAAAVSENDVLMAVEDPKNKLFAVQFHPESVLTPEGKTILINFIQS